MTSQTFVSSIVKNGRLLPGIHGLRGVAAIAVVFYHVHHLAKIAAPDAFLFIGRDFGYSVHLFFILSAFSLMHSTESRIIYPHWGSEYLIKRFFRIAPLFYLMVVFELMRQATGGGITQDLHTILLNLSFTFGFVPFSGFVWGGWSIGVEMIFYVFFPTLVLVIKTHRSALFFLVFTIVTSYSIRSSLHTDYLNTTPLPRWSWSYFSFASNFCFFAMGIYAYRVSQILDKNSYLTRFIIPMMAMLLIGSLMFSDLASALKGSGRLDIIIWGVGLTTLCIWQNISPSLVFANKLLEFLGERSFSIYLIHPVAIHYLKGFLINLYEAQSLYIGKSAFFICALIAILVTLFVAEFTYRLIEVPGIELGRRLIKRRQGVIKFQTA